MGIFGDLNNAAVTANAISGVEVEQLDLTNSWFWTFAVMFGIIALPIVFTAVFNGVSTLVGRNKKIDGEEVLPFMMIPAVLVGVALGIIAGVAIDGENDDKYADNLELIESHYGVSLANEEGNEPLVANDVLSEDNVRFNPVTIEHDASVTDGYLMDLEGDNQWAVVVDADTESSDDFVEFDDFIAEEDNGTGVEEVGSETD